MVNESMVAVSNISIQMTSYQNVAFCRIVFRHKGHGHFFTKRVTYIYSIELSFPEIISSGSSISSIDGMGNPKRSDKPIFLPNFPQVSHKVKEILVM